MQESATLWIVATPIGTLSDLGSRAAEILTDVDRILAEDTRRARTLLGHAGVPVRGRLRSLHEHNEQRQVDGLIEDLKQGRSAALISDAGTPALSDPGFLLVRRARAEGVRVLSVPGASAFSAALAASGQPPLPATLVGFLPPRQGQRRRRIAELLAVPWTIVILLSPHRLAKELADLADGLGENRPSTLMAEISKLHERAQVLPLGEQAASPEAKQPRGEYVLVIGPVDRSPASSETAADPEAIRSAFNEALQGGADRREALKEAAKRCGVSRREVYDLVYGSRKEASPETDAVIL